MSDRNPIESGDDHPFDCQSDRQVHRRFAAELLRCQEKLRIYVTCLVFDKAIVSDIVQEINIIVLEKEEMYDDNRDFWPWVSGIARNCLKSYLRDRKRDRHRFDSDLLDLLATSVETMLRDESDVRKDKLRDCMERLPSSQQRMLGMHYIEGYTVTEMAERMSRKPNAMSQLLFQLRKKLANCIERNA